MPLIDEDRGANMKPSTSSPDLEAGPDIDGDWLFVYNYGEMRMRACGDYRALKVLSAQLLELTS